MRGVPDHLRKPHARRRAGSCASRAAGQAGPAHNHTRRPRLLARMHHAELEVFVQTDVSFALVSRTRTPRRPWHVSNPSDQADSIPSLTLRRTRCGRGTSALIRRCDRSSPKTCVTRTIVVVNGESRRDCAPPPQRTDQPHRRTHTRCRAPRNSRSHPLDRVPTERQPVPSARTSTRRRNATYHASSRSPREQVRSSSLAGPRAPRPSPECIRPRITPRDSSRPCVRSPEHA